MTKPQQPWQCQRCTCLGKTIPRATPRSKLCAWCVQELRRQRLRWCAAGQHGVAPSHFTASSPTRCRDCVAAYNKTKRAERIDTARAYSRAYHAAHREEMIAHSRAYYTANRDELLARKRAYYAANRETIKARVRAYRRHKRPLASILKERQRQREKHAIYKANEKINRARRFVRALRGAA